MVLDRLRQLSSHLTATSGPPHPFDPLSAAEIAQAVSVIKNTYGGSLNFNAVTLQEPRKAEMMAWLASPTTKPRPRRVADVVAIKRGGAVYDGLVDLEGEKVLKWECEEGVQPMVCFGGCLCFCTFYPGLLWTRFVSGMRKELLITVGE